MGEDSWSISLTLSDSTSLKLGHISPISTTHHWAPGAPSRATMVAPPAHMTTKCPPMLLEKVPPSYSGFFGGSRSPLDVSGRGSDRPIMTIAVLTVTTKHGPWEGTNNGHPHHDTNWYDPWPLPTGPAPTTFRSGEDRNHFCSMATTIPMIDFEPSPQPPSTPPNPTHTPTYTHRVMLWTYVGGQTTWLWIITTTTAATEPNAMVRF